MFGADIDEALERHQAQQALQEAAQRRRSIVAAILLILGAVALLVGVTALLSWAWAVLVFGMMCIIVSFMIGMDSSPSNTRGQ